MADLLDNRKIRLFAPIPTTDLYDFKASIEFTYDDPNSDDGAEDMKNDQFIPRGSVIKNSGEIVLMVVYTGQETKLMQNLGSYSFKRSEAEKRVGVTLVLNLAILITFIFACSIWNFLSTEYWFDNAPYITDRIGSTATEVSF